MKKISVLQRIRRRSFTKKWMVSISLLEGAFLYNDTPIRKQKTRKQIVRLLRKVDRYFKAKDCSISRSSESLNQKLILKLSSSLGLEPEIFS